MPDTRPPLGLFACSLFAIAALMPGFATNAEGLEDLDLPIVESDDGYKLAITAYETATTAELFEGEPPEHEIELKALLQPPEDSEGEVLCLMTQLEALSAEDDRGRDQLLRARRKQDRVSFNAVLPKSHVQDRRGRPIDLAYAELDAVALDRPGYEIEELIVQTQAVVVEEREEAEVPASVVDVFHDVGHDVSVRVGAMEISDKGLMTVKIDLSRAGGEDAAVVDSLYAINADGDIVGGGRWTNEADLFGDAYELEIAFPLNAQRGIASLRLVLATEYEVVPVSFTVEGLFRR